MVDVNIAPQATLNSQTSIRHSISFGNRAFGMENNRVSTGLSSVQDQNSVKKTQALVEDYKTENRKNIIKKAE